MMKNAVVVLAAAALAALGLTAASQLSSAPVRALPDPAPEAARASGHVAVLAGGCFWGMEGLFDHIKGVRSVTAGYAGGTASSANYTEVSSENTGHAESIRIDFDPSQVSYGQLLKIYFGVAHDPTQVEGQYPDSGHSYRSAIFPQNAEQRQIAAGYIAALGKAHAFARPIATRLEQGTFYPAEESHQQFMRRHPNHPYIQQWDMPKLQALRQAFPTFYRS